VTRRAEEAWRAGDDGHDGWSDDPA
jgi:hypothetical protein